jgi:hypothetical protein
MERAGGRLDTAGEAERDFGTDVEVDAVGSAERAAASLR